MPQLRRGRILSFVAGQTFAYPGQVYPAICMRAYTPTSGAFTVLTEAGAQYAPTLNVSDGPEQGSVFWPALGADEVDVNFVAPLADQGAVPSNPPQSASSMPVGGTNTPQESVPADTAPSTTSTSEPVAEPVAATSPEITSPDQQESKSSNG